MPQKGFDLIIEAIDAIKKKLPHLEFAVVAVGSGDYLEFYKTTIREKGLDSFFYFLPFRPMVHHLYPQVDVVVMPSRWEAGPLLPMEVLCMGTPLIASCCIGTREIVAGTPTIFIPPENLEKLIETMVGCFKNVNRIAFDEFVPVACKRFDVACSARQLVYFVDQLLVGK